MRYYFLTGNRINLGHLTAQSINPPLSLSVA
jgi:hypothetical protein